MTNFTPDGLFGRSSAALVAMELHLTNPKLSQRAVITGFIPGFATTGFVVKVTLK